MTTIDEMVFMEKQQKIAKEKELPKEASKENKSNHQKVLKENPSNSQTIASSTASNEDKHAGK
jgi:hypothetical protein